MALKDLMINALVEGQFEFAIKEDHDSLHQALVEVNVIDEDTEITIPVIKEKLKELTDEAFLNAYDYFIGFQG